MRRIDKFFAHHMRGHLKEDIMSLATESVVTGTGFTEFM